MYPLKLTRRLRRFASGMVKRSSEKASENSAGKGTCSICGFSGVFERAHKSIREGYPCQACGASLRYRHQAEGILEIYGPPGICTFAELSRTFQFQRMRVYEPGIIGPFRKYFKNFQEYYQSYYWEGVKEGEYHKGIRSENLENLTFADAYFDLVISSDIFEHIRKPFKAFEEVCRILKPGGYHIFTVPMAWPLPEMTQYRVDTSTDEDIFIKPPVYHGSPVDKDGSLVYTDFGLDIIPQLSHIGFETSYTGIQYNLTFFSKKAETPETPASNQAH